MELLWTFLEHFLGDDTDPIDLLPLLVLGFLVAGVRYLRNLMLKVLEEMGALKERVNIIEEIRRMGRRQ